MTNAEKYLKEGVNKVRLCAELTALQPSYCYNDFEKFFNKKTTPALTEDERVILRNIDTRRYPTIKRTKIGEIIVISNAKCGDDIICYMYCYDHLFQFIKEGEEYSIKKLLGDEE